MILMVGYKNKWICISLLTWGCWKCVSVSPLMSRDSWTRSYVAVTPFSEQMQSFVFVEKCWDGGTDGQKHRSCSVIWAKRSINTPASSSSASSSPLKFMCACDLWALPQFFQLIWPLRARACDLWPAVSTQTLHHKASHHLSSAANVTGISDLWLFTNVMLSLFMLVLFF